MLFRFFFFLALAYSQVSALPAGSARIVGGEDAAQGEIPYQISLRLNGTHHCGGSLVVVNGKQVVLTSALCVRNQKPRPFTAVAGDLDRNEESGFEQTRQVIRIIQHESFNGRVGAHDIAILFLMSPFDLNENVQPIPLPESGQKTTGSVIMSGWGSLREGGNATAILQKVEVPTVTIEECQLVYNFVRLGKFFCTGLLWQGGIDTCLGDYGGPVKDVEGGYLAGIATYIITATQGCARSDQLGIHTTVSDHIDWLNTNVE